MSTIAKSTSLARESVAVSRVSFVRISIATVVAAVLANAIFYFIADLLVSYNAQFAPLTNVSGAVIFTAFFAVIAVLVYAVLRRLTHRVNQIFTAVSAVCLLASVIPDITYIPTVPGSSNAQTTVLIAMHVIAAAVIVGMLTKSADSAANS